MAKHTPGPWRASVDISVKAGRFNVCPHVTAGGSSKGMIDERGVAMANARLIAAAPELLEALQDMVKWFGSYPEFVPSEDHYKKYRSAIESANAAIAKATGQCLKGEE